MADYTDLILRYVDGDSKALFVFDQGRQSLEVAVTPTQKQINTAAQLVQALSTGGSWRVKPGTYVGNFKVTAPGVTLLCDPGVSLAPNDASGFSLEVRASGFRMVGGVVQGGMNDVIGVGSFNATKAEDQPDDTTFDGVQVLGPVTGSKRGFAVHARAFVLRHSQVRNIFRVGQEGQAVWVHNGPGPYTIEDNYLEAAGENFLAGGEVIGIVDCIPSNIAIRRNYFYKQDAWRTNGAKVKNILELKNAVDVIIEDNVLDNCWVSGQNGTPVVFTVRNSGAAQTPPVDNPWVTVDRVVFRHNHVKHCPKGYGVNILGHDDGKRASQQTRTITIEDNLFEDSPIGVCVGSGVVDNLTIQRNTFPAITGEWLLWADFFRKSKLNMVDNVGKTGAYVVFASGGHGKGIPGLVDGCGVDGYVMTHNLLEKSIYKNDAGQPVTASVTLPPGNTQLAPGGLTYGPDFTYPADPTVGWSGGDGLPTMPV